MKTGKILWFNKHLGYGFISEGQKKRDVFFHYSALEDKTRKKIKKKTKVEFSMRHTTLGPEATLVKFI